jgi:hypothetical protein
MDQNVRHNEAEHRFELNTAGAVAIADYVEQGDRWVVTHTFVPPELRGGGIAGTLVKATLETARARGKKVVPQCSYVAAYLSRHPEYRDLQA